MPSAAFVHHARHTLREAAARAARAPSIHNTQPWRLHLYDQTLDVELDPARCLPVIDPQRRQAMISCGCAVFNARVAIAAAGASCTVQRHPEGPGSPVLVRIRLDAGPAGAGATELALLEGAMAARTTNRTRFSDAAAPERLVDRLRAAARAEGVVLLPIHHDDHRDALTALSNRADAAQNADPAYRAELRRWTTDDPARLDGVPARAIPHVDGRSGDEIPLRDFDTHGTGRLPARTATSRHGTILMLGTDDDGPPAWLRAGEALERVLLEIARHGHAASPLNQSLEVPATRDEVPRALDLTVHPQIFLRVGRATPTLPTPRRPLAEVLREDR